MKLRMPPELKAQVEEAARAAGRSVNSEIVQRLLQSFVLEDRSKEQLRPFVFDMVDAAFSPRPDARPQGAAPLLIHAFRSAMAAATQEAEGHLLKQLLDHVMNAKDNPQSAALVAELEQLLHPKIMGAGAVEAQTRPGSSEAKPKSPPKRRKRT